MAYVDVVDRTVEVDEIVVVVVVVVVAVPKNF